MTNKQFGAVLELLARLIEEGAKDSQGAAEIIRVNKSKDRPTRERSRVSRRRGEKPPPLCRL